CRRWRRAASPEEISMKHRGTILVCLAALLGAASAPAEKPKAEYRVVFAPARDLGRQLEAAGKAGFACIALARPDPGVGPGGVVAILGRSVGAPPEAVTHRVFVGSLTGTDAASPLEKAGGEGFRLCGVVLDESKPNRAFVAVLSRGSGSSSTAHYVVETLKIWKEALARLKDRAAEGFQPVAAAPVDDNRVRELSSWLVVIERT